VDIEHRIENFEQCAVFGRSAMPPDIHAAVLSRCGLAAAVVRFRVLWWRSERALKSP
jgi:hypothetical protein